MGKEALAESVRSGESPSEIPPAADPDPAGPRLPQHGAHSLPWSPPGGGSGVCSPVSPRVPRHSLYLAVIPGSCPAGCCSPPCQEMPRLPSPLQGDTSGVTLGLPAPGGPRGHLPLSQALAHFPASPASTVCCRRLPCHSGRVIPL